MDRSLKSPGRDASDSASVSSLRELFHRMTELSRNAPPPARRERLDRLARLRAEIVDNETRFEQAISADFGHRCAAETAIAETVLVLGEIRHAAAHLKAWMARKRITTQPQFWPGKTG
jgi:coniferyl-aldehyde dehydrogenase